ncbi:SRPBCC domain-containing protein [Glycomyces tenuis]|uniref:SRPBCC domain-containing protein n=1 Tax=Glycomyces tenuis TaxID=58116 RepID=UPI00041289F7|nr:SRPBCC domain-containing protein [Glycomyces tenuis]
MALIIIALIVVAIAAYCVWAMRNERRIEETVRIEAPAHEVWTVLTDFPSYGEWNPTITSIEGVLAEGERLDVAVTMPSGWSNRFRPSVLRVSPARQFRWLGRLGPGGVFDGEHYFVLEPQDDDSTRFTQGERFTGVLVPLMKRVFADTEQGFTAMNAALIERVAASRR